MGYLRVSHFISAFTESYVQNIKDNVDNIVQNEQYLVVRVDNFSLQVYNMPRKRRQACLRFHSHRLWKL